MYFPPEKMLQNKILIVIIFIYNIIISEGIILELQYVEYYAHG